MDSSDVTIINNLSHIYFGVQPGATFIAWTGGIITFEALRLIQKFDSKVPIMRRAFVVLTLVMSFLLFGTFGAVKYFYAVDSLVDDPRMLKFKNILDWNLGCSRLAVLSGQSFYTYLLLSSTKDSKIGPGRIIKAICFLLIIGCFGLSLVAVSASSQKIDVFEQRRLAWKIVLGVQLLAGLFLTGLSFRNIKSNLKTNPENLPGSQKTSDNANSRSWRPVADKMLTACHSPIYSNIFDLITLLLVNQVPLGFEYSLLCLSSEIYLLTPLLALNFALKIPEATTETPGVASSTYGAKNVNQFLADLDSFCQKMDCRKMDVQRSAKNNRQPSMSLLSLRSEDLDINDRVPVKQSQYQPPK